MIRHGAVAYAAALLTIFALAPSPVARAQHPFGGGGAVVLPVRNVASFDTLAGFGQAGGEPVAIIDARLPLDATTEMAVGGEPARVEETGLETQRFVVGPESGQVVSSQGQIITPSRSGRATTCCTRPSPSKRHSAASVAPAEALRYSASPELLRAYAPDQG